VTREERIEADDDVVIPIETKSTGMVLVSQTKLKDLRDEVIALRAQVEAAKKLIGDQHQTDGDLVRSLNAWMLQKDDAHNRTCLDLAKFERDNEQLRAQVEKQRAIIEAVKAAIPYPAISAGSANALAYEIEQGDKLKHTSSAAGKSNWLKKIAKQLDALDIACHLPLPPAIEGEAT